MYKRQTGDNDAGGKTDRKSRSQRRKEYKKKKAAEHEEAALSNNTQTDEGQKSGTPCGICNRVGHSRDKCFYKNSVETMIKRRTQTWPDGRQDVSKYDGRKRRLGCKK